MSSIVFVFLLLQGRAEPSPIAEFPFQLREGLIWIQVTVPQSAKPLNFMLDSGPGVSVVNLHTAQRLGLKLGNRVSVRGVQTSVGGYWPQRLSASVGDVHLPKDYLAVDLGDLSQACQCGVDGLIGADFFRKHIVQIDYEAKKIRLFKSATKIENSESLPLEMRPCGMRVPLQVNGGKQQWVRLDTGCASAFQWVTSDVAWNNCSRLPAIGVSKLSIPQTETEVRLGKIEFKAIPTGLQDKEIFAGEAGLLGNGLLSRFASITIDTSAHRLILEKSHVGN